MDNRFRQLERLAATGDHESIEALERLKRRFRKELPPLPESLPSAKIKWSFTPWGLSKHNRNTKRLKAHKAGRCKPDKCRFCRKYGERKKRIWEA